MVEMVGMVQAESGGLLPGYSLLDGRSGLRGNIFFARGPVHSALSWHEVCEGIRKIHFSEGT